MTTLAAVSRSALRPRPLGLGAHLYLLLLTVVPILLTFAMAPIYPCHRCGPCPQLVGYTRLPGITPEQAELMMAWGYASPCYVCNKTRRISILRGLQHNSWGEW